MNEEEALKCINIAKQAIQQQNYQKAERFLEKSIRICKTPEAQKLLKLVQQEKQNPQQSRPQPNPQQQAQQEEQKKYEPQYTQEQVNQCKQILQKKDYYEILNVQKNATEDEIKKAYKKLALKFHPDKNQAPQSTEAFKKVSQAFACLNNKDKRYIYDQHGTEENFQQRYNFHEEDIDANDIFRMFFGGGGLFDDGFQRRHVYRTHRNNHNQQQRNQNQQQNPYSQLIQMAPLLFFLVLTLLSSVIPQGNQQHQQQMNYQFHQSYAYPVQVISYRLNIKYFVSEFSAYNLRYNMNSKYRLDEKVEQEIINNYESKCNEVKLQRQGYIQKSKQFVDDLDQYHKQLDLAEQVDMSSCQTLKDYRKKVN